MNREQACQERVTRIQACPISYTEPGYSSLDLLSCVALGEFAGYSTGSGHFASDTYTSEPMFNESTKSYININSNSAPESTASYDGNLLPPIPDDIKERCAVRRLEHLCPSQQRIPDLYEKHKPRIVGQIEKAQSSRRYHKACAWRGRSQPSRFCHICSRTSKKVGLLSCQNFTAGACRKVVCEKCFAENNWDWESASKPGANWICTHCRRCCPERAQCAIYKRTNERRRELQQQQRAKLEQERRWDLLGISADQYRVEQGRTESDQSSYEASRYQKHDPKNTYGQSRTSSYVHSSLSDIRNE